MLVKFLSFTASFIGTGRYKPVLVSAVVLLLSLGGVGFVRSWHDGKVGSVANKLLVQQASNVDHTQQIGDKKQKTIVSTETTAASGSASQPSANNTSSTQPIFTIDANVSNINLQAGQTSDDILMAIKGNATWEWLATADNPQMISATASTTGSSATIRVRAADNASAGTYHLTIQAKNTADHTTVSKVITVTIS